MYCKFCWALLNIPSSPYDDNDMRVINLIWRNPDT